LALGGRASDHRPGAEVSAAQVVEEVDAGWRHVIRTPASPGPCVAAGAALI